MAFEFKLPDLGEGVASADVSNVLVKEGDAVSAEQNVLELETEKAVVELPVPKAGTVSKLHVKPGQTLKPGDLVMTLDTADGAAEKKAAPAKPAPAESKPAAPAPAKSAPAASAPATSGGGGTYEFKLPDLGEGVSKADVSNVLVKEGDDISANQNVVELETEKAVVEVPCPQGGKVKKINVKPGQTITPGTTILTLEGSGAGAAPAPAAGKPAAPAEQSAPAPASKAGPAKAAAPPQTSEPDGGRASGHPVKSTVATVLHDTVEAAGNGAPAPAGPATRRLARELGVDLHRVTGTGPGGRITAEDVQAYVRRITSGEISPSGAPASTGITIPPLPDFTQFGEIERKPMNKMAKTAAANLSLAWQVIPHVTQHELADVTELEAGRKRHAQSKAAGGAKITMTVLAIKAIVAALKQFPHFNASIDTTTNEVIVKHYYNIGIAVDTEQGLVVPVIRDANQKSILELARELDTLATKARDRKLSMADFQGGTFTITNLGGIGGTSFTPIVNYPEVAILGMCRSRQQLVVIDNEPQVRLMLPLSLSYDHRVINGADAARFAVKVAGLLADPSQLLIES
jgi:pyruvate dehydrogenase E2 component (dihydrolipoamide acetyltransferase)